MTRKDYVAIAKAVAEGWADCVESAKVQAAISGTQPDYREAYAVANVVANLCDVFAADNPRFDRERFETACGQVAA
jgi:hypothetical protein